MTSNKPFLNQWQSIPVNEQVEMGLVYVEIIYHRQAHLDSLQLEDLKDLLRDCFQTVAEHWGGKLFSWDRHGGAFMFLVEDSQSYDNCCLSAIQMLEMVPSLNEVFDPRTRRVAMSKCGSPAIAAGLRISPSRRTFPWTSPRNSPSGCGMSRWRTGLQSPIASTVN